MARQINPEFERLLKACFQEREWASIVTDTQFIQQAEAITTHQELEEVVLYAERLLQKKRMERP